VIILKEINIESGWLYYIGHCFHLIINYIYTSHKYTTIQWNEIIKTIWNKNTDFILY